MFTRGINANVIVLNGTGSSGKSTLARALQVVAPQPFIHFGIDALLTGLAPQYAAFGSHAAEGLKFIAGSTGHVEALEAGPAMHRLVYGLHRAVAAMASIGNYVVVDHVLWEDEWLKDCAEVLPSALFVGVRCSRETVQKRARSRRDRPPGYELFAFDATHAGRVYDVEVDMTDSDVARCVAAIVQRWTTGKPQALAWKHERHLADQSAQTCTPVRSLSWNWEPPAW